MGFENVRMLRERGVGNVAAWRDAMPLVYEGEVLVSAWNSNTKIESSLETEQSCGGHRTCNGLEKRNICRTQPRAAYTPLRL